MLMMLMLADLVPLYKKQAELMLMFGCLEHLPSESPPDADEFGAEAARLRLMMFACLGHLPKRESSRC